MYGELKRLQQMQKRRMGGDRKVDKELYNSIFRDFENNPAYQKVLINGDRTLDVHFVHKSRQFGDPEIYIITKPEDAVDVGSYITDKNNDTWICYTRDKYTIPKHFLGLCNNNLRWEHNGVIYDIPCMLSDKTSVYSDGMHRNRRMTLADDQILVTIPSNEITSTIYHGKKFIFNHNKNEIYTTHRIDTLPNPGLMEIKMRRARYNEFSDDLELGISKPSDNEDIPTIDLTIHGYDTMLRDTEELFSVGDYPYAVEYTLKENTNKVELRDNDDNTCIVYVRDYIEEFTIVATVVDNEEIVAEKTVYVSKW